MKKQLIAIAGLALLSTPAMATKARLIALGENIQDNIGSLYFSDSRNIFQNAAYANDYKNMVIMEWGSNATNNAGITGSTATATGDTDQNAQAEGGFLKSAGNFVYGLYLGAESPYTNEIRSYTRSLNNNAFHQDNQIDVFFAGESAMLGKWGVNLTYSNSEDDAQDAKQSSASIRLGMIKNKIEAFANVSLKNEAEIQSLGGVAQAPNGGTDEFKGKLGFELGATYDATVAKLFGYVRHANWEHDADSTSVGATLPYTAYTGKFDGTYWLYQVGAGKEHKINDKATLFAKTEYLNFMRKVEATSGTADGEELNLDDWRVPVTIGLEYDAATWLTLRGSIVQNVVSTTDNDYDGNEAVVSSGVKARRPSGKRTAANSTNVNAGLTLKFGELAIDGVIGTDGSNNSTTAEKGALTLDNLASRVAMTYKF
jgi:hypothetical protein